jgi:CheY-like chemotaxis protein
MPHGGRLTLETDHVVVSPSRVAEDAGINAGRYSRLAVRDTGAGMNEGTRSRIFEPFFTTKERGKASGLGLSTVYGIVSQSGGHIRVHSEIGVGSVFEVWLPVTEQPADRGSDGAGQTGRSLSVKRQVLVIEDQAAVRALVRRILEREGFGVLEAAEARGAERLFDEHEAEIALVVTDVGIPGEKGTALFRRLRLRTPNLRVIYMSGQVEEAVLDEPMGSNERFLAKPFTASGLLAVVQDALCE